MTDELIELKPKEFVLSKDEAAQLTLEHAQLQDVVGKLMHDNTVLLKVFREAARIRSPGPALTAAVANATALFGATVRSRKVTEAFKRLVIAYVDAAPDYGLSKVQVAKKLGYTSAVVCMWKAELAAPPKDPDALKVDLRIARNDKKLTQLLVAAQAANIEAKQVAKEAAAERNRMKHSVTDAKRYKDKKEKSMLSALDEAAPLPQIDYRRYKGEE